MVDLRPSYDFPAFAEFFVSSGIDSISVTPDSVLKTLHFISKLEKSWLLLNKFTTNQRECLVFRALVKLGLLGIV